MKSHITVSIALTLILCLACEKKVDPQKSVVEKKVYIPIEWKDIDLHDDNSEWSYQRSAKSENMIIFWQKGFGTNPLEATDPSMRFNKDLVLQKAERIYENYRNIQKFTSSNTRTDSVRMMIHVIYDKGWIASGAGWDNVIGAFWVTPSALNIDDVVAHEIGHAFQFQVACDGMYGYRDKNYVGSFWEQCAQYMARQLYPASCLEDLKFFTDNSYRNFSNEEIRYQSFHLQEYWKSKHGTDFIGRLWREAIQPEHPLETYKRINSINQAALNDEIADYAMRCITWDFPNGEHVRTAAKRNNTFFKTKLNKNTDNNNYTVDAALAPESYGFNAFELNVPNSNNSVSVTFEGLENAGFKELQGWRYGFVSVDANGKPAYSITGKADRGKLAFAIPAGSVKLWFVVTGAPVKHYNHVWGTPQTEIPKFDYQVDFHNTSPKL